MQRLLLRKWGTAVSDRSSGALSAVACLVHLSTVVPKKMDREARHVGEAAAVGGGEKKRKTIKQINIEAFLEHG